MTEQELLLRLERLEARGEIENLMARYQHYYTLRNSQTILDGGRLRDYPGGPLLRRV